MEQFAARHSRIECRDMKVATPFSVEETIGVIRFDERRSVGVEIVAGFQNSHDGMGR